MKNLGLIFLIFVFTSLCANATVSTDYLQKVYSCQCNKDVTFKSKKEYIDKYEQRLGEKFISSIVYGEADMKIKGKRKKRVLYICMLENDTTPIWGYVLPR